MDGCTCPLPGVMYGMSTLVGRNPATESGQRLICNCRNRLTWRIIVRLARLVHPHCQGAQVFTNAFRSEVHSIQANKTKLSTVASTQVSDSFAVHLLKVTTSTTCFLEYGRISHREVQDTCSPHRLPSHSSHCLDTAPYVATLWLCTDRV